MQNGLGWSNDKEGWLQWWVETLRKDNCKREGVTSCGR